MVVAKKDENIPVYTVKRENGKGKERVLHRNLLLPCEHLPLEVEDAEVNPVVPSVPVDFSKPTAQSSCKGKRCNSSDAVSCECVTGPKDPVPKVQLPSTSSRSEFQSNINIRSRSKQSPV